ncbi:MAG: divalent metal cation transporter [Haliea sp.]|uniref:divalent metal cation transporter n=1 Tax=Marinobacter salarius TaxID=1420917 RepID=UPI0032EFB1F7
MSDRPTEQQEHYGNRIYPLADAIPVEQLDAEAAYLDSLAEKPLPLRLLGYAKLGGPGFMAAAATLGAGTLTSAMLSGAAFGYKLLWVTWVAMVSGLFMMAAMARFTTHGGFRVIQKQRERHGWFMAKILTGAIGLLSIAIIFNFGQVALGTHLIESIGERVGVHLPQSWNWPLYVALTAWISLRYGRGSRGVVFVENFMKGALLLMVFCFGACLVVVGVDWPAALHGFFVPWLPSGQQGIDIFIASSAAAIGVADWVFYHYAGLAKGWGPKHEKLARVDTVVGLALPFIVVSFIVVSVFAATLYGKSDLPETAAALSAALVPLLGEQLAALAFMIGFLAVPITTSVMLGVICAMAMHEIFEWEPDVSSLRWKLCILMPQVALFGAFLPSPILLIIVIAALLSVTNNVVGWSFFLLLNDREVMHENRSKSYIWNLGILVQVTLLNCVAIIWVFNRMGLW